MIGILAILTYILATIFAIAGMGAAGVLIPNYITLGIGVRAAMFLGLGQNTAELTVATSMNCSKKLVDWKKVLLVLVPALFLVPLGAYVNIHIPRILVLLSFALFLLFALYRMLFPHRLSEGSERFTIILLGAIEGFIACLIGMDAAPIALIAFAYIFDEPRKISANTAATALGVSTAALITYYIILPSVAIDFSLLAGVVIAGFLGGITGAFLMHRINPKYVRYTMLAILALALFEISFKVVASYGRVPSGIYYGSLLSLIVGFALFIYAIIAKICRLQFEKSSVEMKE
jgi:uncharacterized membrane protein YfcA